MLPKPLRALWGEFTKKELKKFGILSATLMLIMGNYWMLRPVKNTLFKSLVGFAYQPSAKILSLVVMVLVVLGYSKLVDLFDRHKLFYIICPFYGILFLLIGYGVIHIDSISLSETSLLYPLVSFIPGKLIGWFSYVALESFGSIMAALFWSFVASTTHTEAAKKGYGMVVFSAQAGALIGLWFIEHYSKKIGVPIFLIFGGVLVLLIPILIKFYMTTVDDEVYAKKTKKQRKGKTGFFEGLILIATKPYVIGVFVVTTFYEIVSVILEYQMYRIAEIQFPTDVGFAVFNAHYGMGIIAVALVFALLGTSFVMRKFGLRFCLIAFPVSIGILISSIFFFKTFGATSYQFMWSICVAMIAIKGLNYALNNPTKEVMYIPTSKDVKFKSKGWIDVFGGRSLKGVGAGVNNLFRTNLSQLFLYGTVISLGVVGLWIVVASFVGHTFNKLQEEDRIIE
jgi:ATP:ADP antiporter, AAA family